MSYGSPPHNETLSEWAINILHDEITSIVWFSTKNSVIFSVQIFFNSDEKGAIHNFNHLRKRCIS